MCILILFLLCSVLKFDKNSCIMKNVFGPYQVFF